VWFGDITSIKMFGVLQLMEESFHVRVGGLGNPRDALAAVVDLPSGMYIHNITAGHIPQLVSD